MSKNPYSLLARFYGVYKIQVQYMQPVQVIIMDNLMGGFFDSLINIYDLKGSTFKRVTEEEERGTVLKDLNFLKNKADRIRVSPEVKKHLVDRLNRDKQFLNSCQLMDYSLLLIFFKKKDDPLRRGVSIINTRTNKEKRFIEVDDDEEQKTPLSNINLFHHDIEMHTFEKASAHFQQNKSGIKEIQMEPLFRRDSYIQFDTFQQEKIFYRMGVIDFLQKYDYRKKLETKYLKLKNKNVNLD